MSTLKLPKNLKDIADSDPRKARALATMLIDYSNRNANQSILDTKLDAVNRIRPELAHLGLEQYCAAIYDGEDRFVSLWKGGIGSINRSALFVRTFVQEVLNKEGITIYVAHNHPCGSIKPSSMDLNTKDALLHIFEYLGVSVEFFIVTSTDTIFY